MDLVAWLDRLSIRQAHWLAHKLGVYEGLHDWMPEYCPCWGRR